jgi:hypothetical protein
MFMVREQRRDRRYWTAYWKRSRPMPEVSHLAHFSAAIALASLACATPASAQQSRYRTVSNGVANCLFLTEVLAYQNDDAPGYRRVTQSFSAGDPVYARCYFPQQLGSYARLGKAYNTLRKYGSYNLDLVAVRPGGEEVLVSKYGGTYDRETRDQIRLDIIRTGDCDMSLDAAQASRWGITNRKQGKPEKYCPDMQRITSRLQAGGASVRYCLRVYVPWTDEMQTIRTVHNGEVQYQQRPANVQRKIISEGCFAYDAG